MTIDDFAASTGLEGDQLQGAFSAFAEELQAHRKTLAARAADLAESLHSLGVEEPTVYSVVHLLAVERRR